MQRFFKFLLLPAAFLLCLGLTAWAEDAKLNPAGTWVWTSTGQNGQTRQNTLKLKQDGETLTGTVSGRNGDTAIEGAKLKGDELSFTVTREFNGNKFVQKFTGKLTADTIKGKIEFERDGQTQSRDWDAKREEAKK
jgi:hypothetical protein